MFPKPLNVQKEWTVKTRRGKKPENSSVFVFSTDRNEKHIS